MLDLPRYSLDARLYDSALSTVWRGTRKADGKSVIIKYLSVDQPGSHDLARYGYAAEIAGSLNVSGLNKLLDTTVVDGRPIHVYDDIGAVSLASCLAAGDLDMVTTTRIATRIAEILQELHADRVIHNDINPSNIIYNAQTGVVEIIDLDVASRLRRRDVTSDVGGQLRGTLRYMAPEQTGRMNRPVDYRADLYGFGATLYELLTGEPPFAMTEPLALVHAHIAQIPKSPSSRNKDIPAQLSAIVLKLLEKNPADRYQSARAVAADLARCVQELDHHGAVSEFALAVGDHSPWFVPSDKLYGRDEELAALTAAFHSAAEGSVGCAIVSGFSGVGKSRLVGELRPEIALRKGRFVTAKYDPIGHAPNAAIAAVLGQLVGNILAESDDRLELWRNRITVALGGKGRALQSLVPDLTLLIGEQPPLQPLQPAESVGRFRNATVDFVRALCIPASPVVMFLDDLQWADAGTLQIITQILTDPTMDNLLFVGSYRDNELDNAPLLAAWLDGFKDAGIVAAEVAVKPLDRNALGQYVADSLHNTVANVAALTEVIHSRTHGNPYDTEQLFAELVNRGALSFSEERGVWLCDLDSVRNVAVSDEVAELITRRIAAMPEASGRALAAAACIGDRFDIALLAHVLDCRPAELSGTLFPAQRDEMIAPVGDALMMMTLLGARGGAMVRFRFVHDRVREAAYDLMPADERATLHVKIGRELRDDPMTLGTAEHVFATADQFNSGRAAITDPSDLRELATLNLDAGKRAIEALAFDAAHGYLEAGIDALGPGGWQQDPKTCFALYRDGGEAALMSGAFDRADELLLAALEHAVALPQKVDLVRLRISMTGRASRSLDAANIGFEALGLFGFEAPADPAAWMPLIGAEAGAIGQKLAGRDVASLAELPPMREPAAILQSALLAALVVPAFVVPHAFPFVIMRLVNLSIEFGNSPFSALGYVMFGLLCCGKGNYRQGRAFGELALTIVQRSPVKSLESPVEHLYANFVCHWTAPYEDAAGHADTALMSGISTGNTTFAGLAANNVPYLSLARGQALDKLAADADRFAAMVKNVLKYRDGIAVSRVYRHAIAGLRGDTDQQLALEAEGLSAPISFNMLLDGVRLMVAVIFGEMDQAAALSDKVEAVAVRAPAHFVIPEWRLYQSVAMASLHAGAADEEKARIEGTLAGNLALFEKWAASCSANNEWKQHLVGAELAAARGDSSGAADLFDRAISAAQSAGRVNGEALCNERAARFFLATDRPRVARSYLTDAHFAYVRWGAAGKVARLQDEFPGVLRTRRRGFTSTATGSSTTGRASSLLDIRTIQKASQAISTELSLDGVLRTLIQVAVESAGAERGVLLLPHGDTWKVQALLESIDEDPIVNTGQPLDEAPLAGSVVRYVIRSANRAVIGDASSNDRYQNDPWVVQRSPRSIACTPVSRQGQLVGVLYVENRRVTDAFTDERCEVLDMLSAQAAISLNNAQLYDRTQRLADSMARFLPEEFLTQLGHDSVLQVELGDAVERDMTVLFSDIRGFTTISEAMTPIEIFQYVNRYLRHVGPVIRRHGGFIDKYIGDAVMALFPHGDAGAVRAAIGMLREVRAHNETLAAEGRPVMQIGVGMHFGNVILGTMGEERRIDVSVISDTVNTAARLESLTKSMGVELIVSGDVHRRLGLQWEHIPHRYLGHTVLRGRSTPTRLFDVFAADNADMVAAKMASKATFEAAVKQAESGDKAGALEAFAAIVAGNPADTAAASYVRRLSE